MIQIPCPNKCGHVIYMPNVLKCPFCNKPLYNETEDFSKKHLRTCGSKLAPYMYSERPKGRPKTEEVIRELESQ